MSIAKKLLEELDVALANKIMASFNDFENGYDGVLNGVFKDIGDWPQKLLVPTMRTGYKFIYKDVTIKVWFNEVYVVDIPNAEFMSDLFHYPAEIEYSTSEKSMKSYWLQKKPLYKTYRKGLQFEIDVADLDKKHLVIFKQLSKVFEKEIKKLKKDIDTGKLK